MKYLTVPVVRNLGTGLPLGDVADIDILGWIEDAEGLIDAELGTDERVSLGLAPGLRTEAEPWDFETRRVYPTSFPVPVQSVTSFEVVVSKQQGSALEVFATIDPTLVIINNDDGYLEVLSIALALYSVAPLLTQLGLLEPIARYSYQAGYSIAKVAWRLFPSKVLQGLVDPSESEDNATLNAWHSRLPFWSNTQPVSVTRNGATLDPSTYAVSYDDGAISITAPLTPALQLTSTIRASFTHTIPDSFVRIAKRAFLEAAGEFFANEDGMAGYDSMRNRNKAGTRRKIGPGERTWRDDLDAFRGVAIASA